MYLFYICQVRISESWLERVCERAGRNFTQEEWEFYFPDELYRKTCEMWPKDK